MARIDLVKEVIKDRYNDANCGLFFTRNCVGDSMATIWEEDGVTIDICYNYSYFEVFGLTEEEENELSRFYASMKGADDETATKKCYDCNHCEMCAWRKEVEEQGCEFFDNGNQWIPCSEKLPEDDGYYLVSLGDGDIEVEWYDKTGWGYFDVIAWMPLPKAWKEE